MQREGLAIANSAPATSDVPLLEDSLALILYQQIPTVLYGRSSASLDLPHTTVHIHTYDSFYKVYYMVRGCAGFPS